MKTSLLFGVAVALAADVAFADTLLFKDGLELSGPKVEVLREHEQGVDVKVSYGTVTVLWPRIKKITIDYAGHLANMKTDKRDTARTLCDFVAVLVRHDMLQEAADTCALILEKDKVSEDILYEVAGLMQEHKQWKLAKTACEMILRLNPSRQDVLRRMDEIAKNITELGVAKEPGKEPAAEPGKEPGKQPAAEPGKQPVVEPGKEPVVAEPGKQPGAEPGKEPVEQPAAPKVLEGLEAEEDWVAEQWGNDAKVAVIEQPQVKNKVLSVSYQGADKDKVAIRLGGSWDLTDREALSFDVWNSGTRSLSLTVAFNTMPGWKFFESPATAIGPNQWTTVKVRLTEKRFKCEESKWRNTSELQNAGNVKQIILLIYNTSKEGLVYFDNIRFIDKQPAGPPK